MPDAPTDDAPGRPEQLDELRRLAPAAGEDVPDGMRASEVEQRPVELRSRVSDG